MAFRVFLLALLSLLLACGTTKIPPNLTAEERFEVAKRLFDKGKYLDAKTQFKIITLNNPGSSIVDEAQYYLAETHFKLKEYLLAASEYERVLRMYPQSPLVDDAQYKIGLCYFKLSPGYALDQDYTLKAIGEFQRFLEDHPNSDLVPQVEKYLFECRSKLAQKDYKAGELYRKMGDCRAAVVYFDSVLNNYYDTKFAEKAHYWKAECLRRLGDYEAAQKEFEDFLSRYPKSGLASTVRSRLQELRFQPSNNRQAEQQDLESNHQP